MALPVVPDPKEHPNAYTALSWGSVIALAVVELHDRLSIDISVGEASFAAIFIPAVILFAKKQVNR